MSWQRISVSIFIVTRILILTGKTDINILPIWCSMFSILQMSLTFGEVAQFWPKEWCFRLWQWKILVLWMPTVTRDLRFWSHIRKTCDLHFKHWALSKGMVTPHFLFDVLMHRVSNPGSPGYEMSISSHH